MDSAVQIVIYQRLSEEHGGEPWKLDMLPLVVADWYSPLDKKLKDWVDEVVREGTSVSRALNSVMGKLGASACKDASIVRSVQKVLTGGQFRLGVASGGAGDVGFHVFNLGSIAVRHPNAKIDDDVSVNFIVSEGTHPLRYASDALQTDPGRRLAIFVSGQDSSGYEWTHFCRVKGDKAAMRANTYVDLITGTGVAMTEQRIPRRCYRIPSKSTTKKNDYQQDFLYTDTEKPIGSVLKAINDMHHSEKLALQQKHEGEELILDTPSDKLPKQEKTKAAQPQGSKEQDSGKKRTLGEMQTPVPKPPEVQTFLEADLQAMFSETDLLECFSSWVQMQGSSYKPMEKLNAAAKNAAVRFRANLKGHETCFKRVFELNDSNLKMLYVRLCKNKKRDDAEALL